MLCDGMHTEALAGKHQGPWRRLRQKGPGCGNMRSSEGGCLNAK